MVTVRLIGVSEKKDRPPRSFALPQKLVSYVQALPLFLILGFFLALPILMIAVVSFWDYDFAQMYPDFVTFNYLETLGSWVTWQTYLNTLKYAAIVWAITLFCGFWVAYFLAFHIRTTTMQMVLFLVCTVPFLTSNIIRMISWIPVLGRNGLVNSALVGTGIIPEPIEWLLYSDFAVVLAMVHLYTLFMVTPIFNTLMRIDRSLIEAARDCGATPWQAFRYVTLPLIMPGVIAGALMAFTLSIDDFVITFFTAGAGTVTLPLQIYSMIKIAVTPEVNAVSTLLMLLTLALIIIASRLSPNLISAEEE